VNRPYYSASSRRAEYCDERALSVCLSFRAYISPGRQRHWNIGGSQVERRRRENRGAVGGEGVESGEGLCCAPSQKIYEFFISLVCAKAEALHLVDLATKHEHC